MTNSRIVRVGLLLAALILVFGAVAAAQDELKVAPNNVTVLLENDRVRVLDFHAKAGDKIPMHSHPDYVLYNFTGGKVKFTASDGKTTEVEGKAGQTTWHAAETHAGEIIGPGENHALVIELKAKPHKTPPLKKP